MVDRASEGLCLGIRSATADRCRLERFREHVPAALIDRYNTTNEADVAPRTASMAIERSNVTRTPPWLTASANK